MNSQSKKDFLDRLRSSLEETDAGVLRGMNPIDCFTRTGLNEVNRMWNFRNLIIAIKHFEHFT